MSSPLGGVLVLWKTQRLKSKFLCILEKSSNVVPFCFRLQRAIHHHKRAADDIETTLPSSAVDLGGFSVDCVAVRDLLVNRHREVAKALKVRLFNDVVTFYFRHFAPSKLQDAYIARCQRIHLMFTSLSAAIAAVPLSLDELVAMREELYNAPTSIACARHELIVLDRVYAVLEALSCKLSPAVFGLRWSLQAWPLRLELQVLGNLCSCMVRQTKLCRLGKRPRH